ncbi:MAG TPA: sulfate ABC transporter substrate-binding protein [Polyangiaceae bacterium]
MRTVGESGPGRGQSRRPWFAGVLLLLGLVVMGCARRDPASTGKAGPDASPKEITVLNVSYDPTRELYQEVNRIFSKYWKSKTGEVVKINQSHGGSSKQARAVIDGLAADVVTLAMAADVDAISEQAELLPRDWQKRLPHNSAPFTSTMVFVVRKGNPKNIKDWDDVVKPGVSVIPGNPKTSGGARWTYLAAYGYALEKYKSDAHAKDFIKKLYKNAPVLDSGARGTTTTFADRGIGDVLLNWENDAILLTQQLGDKVVLVYPSVSILAEPTVALLDKNLARHGTAAVAQAYLDFLYTEPGQEIAASHFYRPSLEPVVKKHASRFPEIRVFTVDSVFGGWRQAQKTHFADGGWFDQIYGAGK